LLFEPKLINPFDLTVRAGDAKAKLNIGIPSGSQTAYLDQPASLGNCLLQSATRFSYIPDKPNRIEQVRFSRGIRSGDKHSLSEVNIGLCKISPIFQTKVAYVHAGMIVQVRLVDQSNVANCATILRTGGGEDDQLNA